MEIRNPLEIPTCAEWREWLARNHSTAREAWVILYKKSSGKQTLTYEECVEEALCFGWIDGQNRGLDVERFAQRFSPRRAGSNWCESNVERVKDLAREGRITEAGLAVMPAGLLRTVRRLMRGAVSAT